MKKAIRIITLLLAVAMVCTALTGCGGNGATTSDPQQSTPGEQKIDLGGKAIKVAAWWNPMPREDAATEKEKLQALQYKEAMEKYNFTVEEVVVEQIQVKPQFEAAQMAGDVWADIVTMRAEQADVFAATGALLPMNDLYNFDSADHEYNQQVRDRFTINGKTYAFSYDIYWLDNILIFNKDILDSVGLPYPYEMAANKEWTWDKFEEYVKKCTKRESDGYVVHYGLYGEAETGPVDQYVVAAINKSMLYFEDGKVVNGINDPDYINMVNRARDLFNSEYCLMPAKGTETWRDKPAKFLNGKLAFYSTSMAGGTDSLNEADTDIRWGVVNMPSLKAGEDFHRSSGTINVKVMPAALAKDMAWAKNVAFVYEQIYKNPYAADQREAKVIEELETKLPDPESVEIVKKYQYDYPVTLFGKYVLDDSVFYPNVEVPFQAAMRGENTIGTTVATFEGVLQGLVDDYNSSTNVDIK